MKTTRRRFLKLVTAVAGVLGLPSVTKADEQPVTTTISASLPVALTFLGGGYCCSTTGPDDDQIVMKNMETKRVFKTAGEERYVEMTLPKGREYKIYARLCRDGSCDGFYVFYKREDWYDD